MGYETSLKLTSIPAGTQWWRNGRFGVLYASDSVDAAFAETFGRDLQMLDFTGPALQALNLDARLLHSCDALEVCQHWARWVHGAPEQRECGGV